MKNQVIGRPCISGGSHPEQCHKVTRGCWRIGCLGGLVWSLDGGWPGNEDLALASSPLTPVLGCKPGAGSRKQTWEGPPASSSPGRTRIHDSRAPAPHRLPANGGAEAPGAGADWLGWCGGRRGLAVRGRAEQGPEPLRRSAGGRR